MTVPLSPPRRAAVVLAGGASRRMGGAPKALSPLRGRPMIAWVLETMTQVAPDLAIEIGANPAADYGASGYPLLASATDSRGVLVGVCAALAWAAERAEWLAIAPCDAPLVEPALYEQLFAHAQSTGAPLAYMTDSEGAQPLLAVLAVSLLEEARAALDRASLPSLQGFYAQVGGAALAISHERWALNVNTAQDLVLAEEALAARQGRR